VLIFDVEVDSYAVRRDLAGILERLGPEYVKRFLRQAGGVAKASVKASFSAGGRPSWAPLSPNTLTRRQYASKAIIGAKEHRKSHAQREVERGNRTATDKRFRRARGTTPLGGASGPFGRSISVRSVGDETVWVGPPRGLWGLFAIHATGSARMPAREVVYLQPGDVAVIDQKAEDFVDKALGTGGLI
jgi:phage gpG-like protein